MSPGHRFARRLAAAVATFELVAGLTTGAVAPAGAWQALFVLTAPFAIYGLLLVLAGRLFERAAGRAAGWLLYAAAAAVWFALHRRGMDASDAAFALAAAAAGALLLLAPSARLDRALRLLPPACLAAAVLGLIAGTGAAGEPWRGLPAEAAPPADAPNLVLVSWDTVRADVLSLYGGAGADTPHLDRLAAEGVTFDDAVAVASITGPSHASMLTGRYPPMHGLRSNGAQAIAPGVPTLAEMLLAAGYRTGGFVSAYPVLGKFGFARGFELYDDRLPVGAAVAVGKLGRRNFLWLAAIGAWLPKAPDASLPGELVNARAAEWLRRTRTAGDERPFFLFVHYYDAHGPFAPPEPWRAAALAAAGRAFPPAADPAVAGEMTLYRGEISQVDALLGELLAELERSDPGLRRTLVAVTSDHGECFGEGGILLNHTPSLYEATQRVPLVVRPPGGLPEPARVRATATHLDLVPTLLAAAGVQPPESFGGPGLLLGELDALRPPGSERRRVYLEAQQLNLGDDRKIGWRAGAWKLVRWADGREALWGFRPGELEGEDLRAREPDRLARLAHSLDAFLAAIVPVRGGEVELGSSDAAALDALGYAND